MWFNLATSNHAPDMQESLAPLVDYTRGMLQACGHEVTISPDLIFRDAINLYFEHFLDGPGNVQQLRHVRAQGCRVGVIATELMVQGTIPYAKHGMQYLPGVLERRMDGFHAVLPEIDFLWSFLERTADAYRPEIRNCEFLPFGCLDLVPEGMRRSPKQADIFFFGRVTPHRLAIVQKFVDAGINIITAGDGFGGPKVPRYLIESYLDRARIGLNLTLHAFDDSAADADPRFASCARMVQMLERSVMVLSEEIPLDNPYREFCASAPVDGLVDLCRQLLAQDRWAIDGPRNAMRFHDQMNVRKVCAPVIARTLATLGL